MGHDRETLSGGNAKGLSTYVYPMYSLGVRGYSIIPVRIFPGPSRGVSAKCGSNGLRLGNMGVYFADGSRSVDAGPESLLTVDALPSLVIRGLLGVP